jgi:hypothetical protein
LITGEDEIRNVDEDDFHLDNNENDTVNGGKLIDRKIKLSTHILY